MSDIQRITAAVSAAILAILNAVAGMGVALPVGFDAQGVTLVDTAVLAIAAAAFHFMGRDATAA